MQSTGHSSIHALSLMSTQGSAMVYVTDVSPVQWAAGRLGPGSDHREGKYAMPIPGRLSQCVLTWRTAPRGGVRLLILDVADTSRPVRFTRHHQVQLVA